MDKKQSPFDNPRDEITVREKYFGEMAASAKSPILRGLARFVFDSQVRRRRIDLGLFSISFRETELCWYTNFLNKIYVKFRLAIPCFYTGHGDELFAYVVHGNREAKYFYALPEEEKGFLETRETEWQKQGEKFNLDAASVKEERTMESFSLSYEGDWRKSDKSFHIFERITFVGVDKVVVKAVIPKESDEKIRSDVEKIANSIFIKPALKLHIHE